MVGPNNAGKSTIIGAFRILAEGMRKANAKKPTFVQGPNGQTRGYDLPLKDIPVASENIFFDYNEDEPASIKFRLSNANELLLYFPEAGVCNMICDSKSRVIDNTVKFKKDFNAKIGFVPILGPVEHLEQKYQPEAARLALLTYRAARNFRNIWFHYPEDFGQFRELIKSTWPGMDIEPPIMEYIEGKAHLFMMCPESRIPREIFWAGFGFQVWCQMLTYIIRNKDSSIFIIDEPDIYLHSDLQRQLLGILKSLGPDILIATHSTEIISEADADDLLIVNKKFGSAKKIKDPSHLQNVFEVLGSNLNPTLTQLAKSKKALFVEGKDFQVLSKFARLLDKNQVANRSDFAVIPVEGFNPQKVKNFKIGIEFTLGTEITSGVVFDKDYRSEKGVKAIEKELQKFNYFAHIHSCKEIENFLLIPNAIDRAIKQKLVERNRRGGTEISFEESVSEILKKLSNPLKNKLLAKYQSERFDHEKAENPDLDKSTITEAILEDFEAKWNDLNRRFKLLPGKEFISEINKYLQEHYKVSITHAGIVSSMKKEEVPKEIEEIISKIDSLRLQ
jgi:hypothetical protein